ncbi:MAG: NUDIX hydrolase [Pseudomonadota bacterium]
MPLTVPVARKTDLRTQFSALCYRVRQSKSEVLLVTSRNSGRWITPKGWPMPGRTPAQMAAQEAWEEAGVTGRASDLCLGLFSYIKELDQEPDIPCVVLVYPVRVDKLARDFPERKERKRKWFTPKKAATKVCEPELARMLQQFDAKALR